MQPTCTAELALRSDAKLARCRSSPVFSSTTTDAISADDALPADDAPPVRRAGSTRQTGVSRNESAELGQPHTPKVCVGG